ncbi:tyrosine-protein kinase family protein [Clostridium lacusfryxellense]|uniref:tyrosine-protein kinase family protein n=1 Tax=Clostridium lacusfryxellense TaxID=205328 RepID=UPI001C0E4FD5|nr:CpsD/CapB family tyrosine-protein kinase [Clostridium lacusfryxellense]MBU3111047.1 CpsD/CapB family tyrosine-protein kinase [Clostridium lacusfryxellense]
MKSKGIKDYDLLNMPVKEAYNALRENVRAYNKEEDIKTITVLSCKPREGKTTMAINLSISLARINLKVLLIDANLRNPVSVSHFHNNNNDIGLTDYLTENVSTEDIIYKSTIENLYCISAGTKYPNPSEQLTSIKLTELLNVVRKRFDFVIIDTPPLGSAIDGITIAAQTDGSILMIKSGNVQIQTLREVRTQLLNFKIRVLGTVLNRVDKREFKRHYSDYSYFNNKKNFKRNLAESKKSNKVKLHG